MKYSTEDLLLRSCCNFYKGIINGKEAEYISINHSEICWGGLLGYLRPFKKANLKLTIRIYNVYLKSNTLVPYIGRHGCLMTRQELLEYLDSIKIYYPFEYTLDSCHDGYMLYLNITATKVQLLWILNLIRHIYEYPFNLFLKDAIMLQKEYYPKEHIVNLLQVVATSAHRLGISYNIDQSLGCQYKQLLPLEYIIHELSKVRKRYIENIYEKSSRNNVPPLPEILRSYAFSYKLPKVHIRSYSFWLDVPEDVRKEWILYYCDVYKALK